MQEIRQEDVAEVRPLQRIYCLSGCTAVGKTELALRWAETNGAEIVNCDSLLFYRGMDIGTAKPSASELSRVTHHLIDLLEPNQQMDIGRYLELAIERIRQIQARGRKALVTGGSGFYLKAFFQPVVDAVIVSQDTRERVQELIGKGLDVAVSELWRRNPDGLDGLDIDNPRRVKKALERCMQSGQTLQELKAAFAQQTNDLVEAPKSLCVLERNKGELNERIAMRVSMMLEQGLVAEVEALLEKGIEQNPSACGAIGYRETIAYLCGEYDLLMLANKISTNTRRLAKKQRTWFRNQLPGVGKRLDLSGGELPELDVLFS
ncbi:tRNA (adenosine(37)-N6)-dimethylallyltransferase MiaA [Pelagicoccus sp. SDUM812002]|uniref:tRNA (adenosine(37)-N6)-dimethylallyltransferase MiaA n=1 Tax=Pelagicoccus sp. SDUM812002 TaxID=3041266 RepID=UPI00280FCE39|nr:tRNA (adenosine(37)-N6)-dimethylallyltransferase MiaA [Pelagicoccus sp. SDUM812002]MDQ8187308.1 tRNA (adenosine(37)-N6)-dimethylallyltransferase MiaA [Pelagicoccus sp. SDUM812002]